MTVEFEPQSKMYAEVEYRKYVNGLREEIESLKKSLTSATLQVKLAEGVIMAKELILEKLTKA